MIIITIIIIVIKSAVLKRKIKMKQIRTSVFETNSSSTHSLVIMTEEEYNLWKRGIFALMNEEVLVKAEGLNLRNIREEIEELEGDSSSKKNEKKIDKLNDILCEHYHPEGSLIDKDGNFYWVNGVICREEINQTYITPAGEKIVAISIYGSTED